jgi:hypothetical protein
VQERQLQGTIQEKAAQKVYKKGSTRIMQDRQQRQMIKKGNTVSTTTQEVCKKGSTGTIQEKAVQQVYKKGSTRIMQERQHSQMIKKGNTIRTTAQEVCKKGSTRSNQGRQRR